MTSRVCPFRMRVLPAIVSLLALVAAGCEIKELEPEAPLGLTEEEEVVVGDENQGGDAPNLFVDAVALEWDGIGSDEAVETTALTLRAVNQSASEKQVEIAVRCSGLLGKQVVLPIGNVTLGGGEEETVDVPVTDLPIQNAAGASQLAAVAVVREADAPPDTFMDICESKRLYYRFDAAYEYAAFFSRKVLVEEYGGCLAGICTGNTDPDQVLGKVADGEGGFVNVTLAEQTQTVEEEDVIIAPPEGASIGAGDQPDVL